MTPQSATPWLIIITGAPASGKSTLGREIANRFSWPFLAKDGVKERLFDVLGWRDRDWSRKLSWASFEVLFYALEAHLQAGQSLVIEGNFRSEFHAARLLALQDRYAVSVVQVVLTAAPDVLLARFKARDAAGVRHPGHVDAAFYAELARQLADQPYGPLAIGGAVVQVDTTALAAKEYGNIVSDVARLVSAGTSLYGPSHP
ncbi:MAG: AAA family ATPase [Anaerolineae bacterium]|nr:AAA family ATPase [Anaerolineae bacterium]